MHLIHGRCQAPVGQGGFNLGYVQLPWHNVTYIYDCGSLPIEACRNWINEEAGCFHPALWSETTVLVFLSHLDQDHVNGIKHLLQRLRSVRDSQFAADYVFLPYFDVPARLGFAVQGAFEEGPTSDPEYRAFLADPRAWLVENGAKNVVFVTPSNGEEPGPIPHPSPRPEREHPQEPHGELGPWEFEEHPTEPGALVLSCAQTIPLQWQHAPVNFLFATFVNRSEPRRLATFKERVLKVLKVQEEELASVLRNDTLVEAVACPATRRQLRRAYDAISPEHNDVSMLLYAGPAWQPVDIRRPSRCYRGWRCSCCWRHPYLFAPEHMSRLIDHFAVRSGAVRTGWLGTGDAHLNNRERFGLVRRHYRRLVEYVATVQAPHHGAESCFNPSFFSWSGAANAVFSAGRNNRFGHPRPKVVASAAEAFANPVWIAEDSAPFTEVYAWDAYAAG